MFREFFLSGTRRQRLGAFCGLFVFIGHAGFKAYLKWALNFFYTHFYDSLQDIAFGSGEAVDESEHFAIKRAEVFDQLVEFAWLVAPAVVVHPTAKWIASVWRLSWRLALVRSYLSHYDVTMPAIEGTAQRIHEDTQRFESGVHACFTMLLDSGLTLAVFIPVLLEVGAQALPPGIDWPPWLLSIAVGAAVGGLVVSICVGQKLVSLEVENQKVEAKLRTKLVILEENPIGIVGYSPVTFPPPQEAESVIVTGDEFTDIVESRLRPLNVSPVSAFYAVTSELWTNYQKLFVQFALFNTWISSYDQTMVIAPFILVAPLMFAEDPDSRITLGTLMRTSNAFGSVFGAMAVLSENWASVNDFRSTVRRLREFERVTYSRKSFRPHRAVYTELSERTCSTTLENVVAEISLRSTPM